MFRLSNEEWINLRSQFATLKTQVIDTDKSNRSQIVTGSQKHRGSLPYAFTEQGVAMLSGIHNSDKAIQMNIAIMRAFVETRRILLQQVDLKEQLKELKDRVSGHDAQLKPYPAFGHLLLKEKEHAKNVFKNAA